MKKLIRITTVPLSLEKLLENQPRYFSQFYNIILISSDIKNLIKVGEKQQVPVHYIPLTRKINPFVDLMAIFKLYKFLIKEKPDIVHTHTPKAGFVGMIAAYLARVPVRMHTIAGLPLMEVKGLLRRILNFIEIGTYFCATNLYSNSKGLLNFILDQKFCNSKKIKVLGKGSSNGIDLDFFNPKLISVDKKNKLIKDLGIKKTDFVYCFIGRLVSDKGINELINSFKFVNKEYSNAKLLLVGNMEEDLDPLDKETIYEIKNNQNIFSVGFKNDIRLFLSISHCFVFPSYREGLPNVLLQAGAMSIPSITSDINGCNEIIRDKKNGLIIPSKNIKLLIKSMLTIINNSNLRINLSKNCRSMIIKNYKQEIVWKALKDEYELLSQCTNHLKN